MEALRSKLVKHKAAVLKDLDISRELLTLLSKTEILDITDCVQLQQMKDKTERNRTFIEKISSKEDDSVYAKLIECLQTSGQSRVSDRLIDISEEMHVLNNMQGQLTAQLKQMSDFLKTEERRSGIYLTEPQMDDDDTNPAMSETEVWTKVQESIQRSQKLLTRCQNVINKLHKDCETVAKQNADIVEYTKECDAKIKSVLSHGRKSAKHRAVPKKTQDIFESLMNDIEKLVKSRKNVLTKETEGRRHSTRIVRQCRDWLGGRCTALQKLNAIPAAGPRHHEFLPSDGASNTSSKEAPPNSDNAIISILESLQLLERELQEYMHQEVTLSDKYRSELRRKHLQKQVHGYNVQGFEDMENALKSLQKSPENASDSIAVMKSCVEEINKEYGQCLVCINKIVSDEELNGEGSPSPRLMKKDIRTPRNLPDIFKAKQTPIGKSSRSPDNSVAAKDRNEANQLLAKMQVLVAKYEEMKSDDQMLSSKHRIEMSKRKRDLDIVIQRKDDQLIKLQTQLKELEAEKEKYKKLYNDTKIGYQRNHDNVTSPR